MKTLALSLLALIGIRPNPDVPQPTKPTVFNAEDLRYEMVSCHVESYLTSLNSSWHGNKIVLLQTNIRTGEVAEVEAFIHIPDEGPSDPNSIMFFTNFPDGSKGMRIYP